MHTRPKIFKALALRASPSGLRIKAEHGESRIFPAKTAAGYLPYGLGAFKNAFRKAQFRHPVKRSLGFSFHARLRYTEPPPMNRTSLSLLLLTACTFSAVALAHSQKASAAQSPWGEVPQSQPGFSPQLLNELAAIKTAALADDYAYHELTHLTENIGPRPSGSPQAQAAVDYVAAELRRLGLEVQLEKVTVPHWVRGAETGELVEYPGQAPGTRQKIVLTALGGSTATPADGITADMVVVNNFEELKALGREKISGKIVLFNEIFDQQKSAAGIAFVAYSEAVRYRGAGPKAAADLGAVAALVRSVADADFRLPHTGWSAPAGIPAAAVTAEDADLIADLFRQGKVRLRLTLTPQKLPDATSYNVIADLKGSEHPEQIVVVSGHLDSWDLGTGAIDDGAGVVVAMETAELVETLHLRPKRTLRVIAWMDEENGGAGAQQYTRDHSGEFRNHVAAIESDSGAAHPLGFDLRMVPQAVPMLRPVVAVLQSFGATALEPSSYAPGADIAEMSEAGVPALGLRQDGRTYFHYHHSAADTLDKVDSEELRENAAAMAVMGYALASMKVALPR
jgi:carboxypeptidase Q